MSDYYIDQCMGATAIGLYCKIRIVYEEMVPIVSFTKHGRANPTVKYCILLYFIVSYCILLYFMVFYGILLYFTVFYCILLYFIVFYCILLYLIVFYCI